MSTQTQEVRTRFVWDTGDVDKGVQRIERALDRVKQADSSAKKGASHGADGNNFAMGFRDLAEGRGVNAMQRFGHAIGATAGRLVFYMAAIKAAGAATRWLMDEIDRGNENSRKMEDAFVGNNRSATFSSSANSPSQLAELRKKNIEALKAENDNQAGLQSASEIMASMENGNPFSKAAAYAIKAKNAFDGKRSPEEEIAASRGRGRVYSNNVKDLQTKYSESLENERDIAHLNSPSENPYDAKRKELQIQEQLSMEVAKEANASERDKLAIQSRFSILRQTLSTEEALTKARLESANARARIDASPLATRAKRQLSAEERIAFSKSLLNSDSLNPMQRQQEETNLVRAQGDRRDSMAALELNADGSRRDPSAIARDKLNERLGAQRRARFFRQIDARDSEADRRRDMLGAGLHSGGLSSTGLTSGSLTGGALAFANTFRKEKIEAVRADNSSESIESKTYQLLLERLPKTTN